jgi:hypothetical protein
LGFLDWLSKLFSSLGETKQYGVPSKTESGEQVKSRAEQRVADYLRRNNIRYRYEDPVYAGWFDGKLGYPDFHLLDYNVLVEYWGLEDAEDRRTRDRYVSYMKRKMAIYHKHHIRFISLYPRNLDNLDCVFRAKFKEVTGRELPRQSAT